MPGKNDNFCGIIISFPLQRWFQLVYTHGESRKKKHPLTPGKRISKKRVAELVAVSKEILAQAIAQERIKWLFLGDRIN
ncbi:hypothetical protein AKG39_17490 [Acetobacterium bakii]|uniref:Uncharacterized protein n=1 Tax=Acetobacterium bakii TaxID=52689 RepID=A0A0L6TW21_9FIRM|nr:hypothetical protein [Acetobacterium bakii]KNZ40459.1 hypothetical protein AKG39_17490 [Acetobacterium bakii]